MPLAELLAARRDREPSMLKKTLREKAGPSESAARFGPFRNEPVLELRRHEVRADLAVALGRLDETTPRKVAVLIGETRRDDESFLSTDPGTPARVVGTIASATVDEVDDAVALATDSWRAWANRSSDERAAALLRAAAWMRARRSEIAALEVRECAKPWSEADADVCEKTIDYLEYYARSDRWRWTGAARLLKCPASETNLPTAPGA